MTILDVPASEIVALTLDHVYLAGLPLVIGLLLAIPLGWMALRRAWLYAPVIASTGLLYTIPSLALFILLPGVLGTQILDPLNVVVAMTLYTIALLTRTVADGLSSVPEATRQAATAMGFSTVRRLFQVELPLAVPVIAAGLRVAAVSNVSIVSVAALVGVQQLGILFTDGFNRNAIGPIVVGVVGCLFLALLFDAIILGIARLLTPWQRAVAS
ncbi:MAG TPA: ABC transporter permease [Ornithinimicrobium sp.]|uniref:ABC transporter permease n=1 Tax=Ornithinimicrobium sp. TaxID=1977084 RepID=UPI002B480346|nr:ABC transporter permease [Ornithinimicrobium sp.]HKJ11711.1 ABC transporter permease [Ornithinimicrobium sp.]